MQDTFCTNADWLTDDYIHVHFDWCLSYKKIIFANVVKTRL